MKNCDKVKIKISAYLDGEITASEWRQVEVHIQTCASCTETFSAFQKTTDVFRRDIGQREPSDRVWSQIVTRLESLDRPSTRTHLLDWLKEIGDRLLHSSSPTVRFAQAGFALAAVLILIVLFQAKEPPTTEVAGPPNESPSEENVETVPPPPFDPVADKQRFVQASLVQQVRRYLERTGVLLLEVKNSEPEADPDELRDIRKSSEGLLEETILIKQSLKNSELTVLMKTIDQLEMLLFDVANLNEKPDTDDIKLLKATILQNDLLIKIEIYDVRELDREARKGEAMPSERKTRERQI